MITKEPHDDLNVGISSKSTSNFILLPVTKLSNITWSCIKKALTILLRRAPTFHLKESLERGVTSSSQHSTSRCNTVESGSELTHLTQLLLFDYWIMVSMANELSAKHPATLAISDAILLLYHLIKVQNSNPISKAVTCLTQTRC